MTKSEYFTKLGFRKNLVGTQKVKQRQTTIFWNILQSRCVLQRLALQAG